MEALKLSEQELRVYGECFQACDIDNTQKISGLKASELFRTSGLNQETLQQITELCGAKRLGHFGRSQFYIALKLIAAAQCGLPVKFDSFNSGKEISLPKFSKLPDPDTRRPPFAQQGTEPERTLIINQAGALPPPPTKQHVRSLSSERLVRGGLVPAGSEIPLQPMPANAPSQQVAPIASMQQNQGQAPVAPVHPAPVKPVPVHPAQAPAVPPGKPVPNQVPVKQTEPVNNSTPSPPVMKSPPTSPATQPRATVNNIQAKHSGERETQAEATVGWASFEEAHDNHGLISQENVNQEEKEWAKFSSDTSSKLDSSDVSSDQESVDDVWSITDEQKEYYTKQFLTLQPDINGVILGANAKEFFEKSKLPADVLSKIWRLSDVNGVGALTLDEFCAAMHLVVLRRNDIPLPDTLPPSLMPYSALKTEKTDEPFNLDLPPGSTIKRPTPDTPPPNHNQDHIVHPVALRMSPDGQLLSPTEEKSRSLSDPSAYDQVVPNEPNDTLVSPTATKPRSVTESYLASPPPDTHPPSKLATPLQSRPRPTPKKPQPVPGAPSTGPHPILPPPIHSTANEQVPLPERPNNLGQLAPPAVPPRGPPKETPTKKLVNQSSDSLVFSAIDTDRPLLNQSNFAKFETIPSQEALNVTSPTDSQAFNASAVTPEKQHKRAYSLDINQMSPNTFGTTHSAVQSNDLASTMPAAVSDRKSVSPPPVLSRAELKKEEDAKTRPPVVKRQISRDKKEIQAGIRKQKEQNTKLSRLNSELNQELQEVMEQRIALEIQLEHLRPFSNS